MWPSPTLSWSWWHRSFTAPHMLALPNLCPSLLFLLSSPPSSSRSPLHSPSLFWLALCDRLVPVASFPPAAAPPRSACTPLHSPALHILVLSSCVIVHTRRRVREQRGMHIQVLPAGAGPNRPPSRANRHEWRQYVCRPLLRCSQLSQQLLHRCLYLPIGRGCVAAPRTRW